MRVRIGWFSIGLIEDLKHLIEDKDRREQAEFKSSLAYSCSGTNEKQSETKSEAALNNFVLMGGAKCCEKFSTKRAVKISRACLSDCEDLLANNTQTIGN